MSWISVIRILAVFFSILMAILSLAETTNAGTEEIQSVWTDEKIQIDGKSIDWKNVSGLFLSKQSASVAVCNDSQYVYILFRANDAGCAKLISATGLTLYFDVKGGKRKDYYLKFKGGPRFEPSANMRSGVRSGFDENIDSQDRRRLQDSLPTLSCYIKDKIEERRIAIDGSEGPAAAFDSSQGFYVYEFGVPLAKDSAFFYGISANFEKKLGIGLMWGDMEDIDMPDRGSGGQRGGGMPPGGGMPGGGMPPDGRMPGGMGGPGGGFREEGERPEKQEAWLKVSLAASIASAPQKE
jgi:hypothetical protein